MVRHKERFSPFPRKGTKQRVALAMMFRQQGATAKEIMKAVEVKKTAISRIISRMRDDCGVDIWVFPGDQSVPYHPVIYKVVGIMKWSGEYRSFVDPEKYVGSNAEQAISNQKGQ